MVLDVIVSWSTLSDSISPFSYIALVSFRVG